MKHVTDVAMGGPDVVQEEACAFKSPDFRGGITVPVSRKSEGYVIHTHTYIYIEGKYIFVFTCIYTHRGSCICVLVRKRCTTVKIPFRDPGTRL